MRFLWAALAVAPFVAVVAGMLTGRVRARSWLPAEQDPDEVARVVEFLADPESGYITGQVFGVNGGLYM